MAPVEEDCGIAGRHLIREVNRAALHELQGERWEPVTLLKLFAHLYPPYAGCVDVFRRVDSPMCLWMDAQQRTLPLTRCQLSCGQAACEPSHFRKWDYDIKETDIEGEAFTIRVATADDMLTLITGFLKGTLPANDGREMMQPLQCGSPGTLEMKGDYRYTKSGLKNVVLQGITLHKCRKCGELLPEIPHIEKLHAKIALELLYKQSPLTGEEIRFLRKEMRLKANELAALLGVHKVTVSRWENNEEKIGSSSDRLLRYIYATRHIEELALHLSELGGKKVSEEIRHDVRQIEEHVKAMKRTMVKRRPIAIDLAK
jgi:putative zinc finger/helix-turn-helix YgiT family protein